MISVFYDDDCDQLWVSTRPDPFPPRTLVATEHGDQIVITRCVGTNIVAGETYDMFVREDGSGFADAASALAYLQGEFAKGPEPVQGPRGPGIFTADGEPDPTLGTNGDLYIDAISGDLFSKGD